MSEMRYTRVAIALHWAIAALIIGQLAGGLLMVRLPNDFGAKFALFQLHKSFGFSILALTAWRIVWRLGHTPPPLPEALPGWQKLSARFTQYAFYALLIAMPLLGWAMVSVATPSIDTKLFGLVPVPHLPLGGPDEGAARLFDGLHARGGYLMIALLVLHVGAALQHAFVKRDGVFAAMAPRAGFAWALIAAMLAPLFLAAIAYQASGATGGADIAQEERVRLSADASACEAEKASPNWRVIPEESRLGFTGAESGDAFSGEFENFDARIAFYPDDLNASWLEAEIDAASFRTGGSLRDETAMEEDWFDAQDYPRARFLACEIIENGEGYRARGELTIKESTVPVTLAFEPQIDGARAQATARAELIRTEFGLGEASSWLEDEGVALEVGLEIEIAAERIADD